MRKKSEKKKIFLLRFFVRKQLFTIKKFIIPEHKNDTKSGHSNNSPPDPNGTVFRMLSNLKNSQLNVTVFQMTHQFNKR
jgi:hypothetical protein